VNNLLEGNLASAVEALAMLATQPEKMAGFNDYLTSLGNAVKDSPTLSHALVGGGVGAGIGGLGTLYNNSKKDPSDRRSVLGSMLTGGLAGAGTGAGIGLARTGLSGLTNASTEHESAKLAPGEFIDPATSKRMKIDPAALKENGLTSKVRGLMAPSVTGIAAAGILGGLEKVHDLAPLTTTLAAPVAAADLAMHAPFVGAARTTAKRLGGYWGEELLRRGIPDATGLRNLPTVRKALESNSPVDSTMNLHGASPRSGKTITELLGRQAGKGVGDMPALTVSNPLPETVTHKTIGDLKQHAYTKSPEIATRQPYRVGNKSYFGMSSVPKALGVRAGLYGAPIAAEWFLRETLGNANKEKSLHDIMRQYAKEVEPK
jgi:hypothetical protein